MTCAGLLKLKHVQYICIFFILYLIFHICGKSRTERTNKSKKKTNHIYIPSPIRLKCILLVLSGLPCYHHEMEVILLNVNITIQASIVDIILFAKFFYDPVFVYYQGVL